jgi:hypothetical protein
MVANLPALEMRTSAAPKMATEGIKSILLYIREDASLSLNEAAKMRCGSNVSNSTGLGVLVALQDTGKPVDMRTTDSAAQTPKRLGRAEVLL